MPGIVGLISRQHSEHCRRLLAAMMRSMHHESYYVSGTYAAPELGVYVGWTALQSSFADCQPATNDTGDVVLAFSGECFGGPQNAAGLIREYDKRGNRFVKDLNGLFSGILIDRRRRYSVLFNDRYGAERLYYHETLDSFFFASEAKAILRVVPQSRTFDPEGLRQYFHYGSTLGPITLFRGISVLPGASFWQFADGECAKSRYFQATTWEAEPELDPLSFTNEFRSAVAQVVPRYFETGSNVGISLTGGLDTRLIMAYRPEFGGRLASYTFTGATGQTLDAIVATRVAAACHVPHHLLRMAPDFFSEFRPLADRTVFVTDGYLGVCGAHELYLNRLARHIAPVRLTGNFGSEILRGATTFKPLGISIELLHPDVRDLLSNTTVPVVHTHPVTFAAFAETPYHLFGVSKAAQSQVVTRTPYLDNDLVRLAYRAPRSLRHSPKPALDAIRRSATGLELIPTDMGVIPASPLRSLAAMWYRGSFKLDYWRKDALPTRLLPIDALLSRLDRVLSSHRYLLYRQWFKNELAAYIRDELADRHVSDSLWNRGFVHELANAHIRGRANYLREINLVLTISAIERSLLRNHAPLNG